MNGATPEPSPEFAAFVSIGITPEGRLLLQGSIENEIVALGLLVRAQQMIREHHAQRQEQARQEARRNGVWQPGDELKGT